MSQRAAAAIGMAMMRLKVSIQAPGRGRSFIQAGTRVRISHGSAMPKPKDRKMSMLTALSCNTAYPSAAPMKGAVQGEAPSKLSVSALKSRIRIATTQGCCS